MRILLYAKISNTFVDNAEDLGSDNYSVTSGSLWNYCGYKVNNDANEIVANLRLNNNKTTKSKYFE